MFDAALFYAKAAMESAASLVGVRLAEEPRHETLARIDSHIEIRRYGPRLVAETSVAAKDRREGANEGFSILAGYIFGKNRAKARIAMTAPVETAASQRVAMTAPVETVSNGGAMRMRFFLPADFTPQNAPVPLDPRVSVHEIEGETLAVLSFSGAADEAVLKVRQEELRAKVQAAGWRITGEPRAMLYDPPWTLPFLRRNEVAVPVERMQG